jgi:hypothetical protein
MTIWVARMVFFCLFLKIFKNDKGGGAGKRQRWNMGGIYFISSYHHKEGNGNENKNCFTSSRNLFNERDSGFSGVHAG